MPLTQTFIGVKATNKTQQLADMDRVCFEKVLEEVQKGEQVSVYRLLRMSSALSIGMFGMLDEGPQKRSCALRNGNCLP